MCLRTGNCLNKRGKHTHSSQNLKQSNQYQVAMSLHWLSDEALKVYNGFYFDGEEHAVGQVNVAFQFSSEKNSKAIRGLSKSCSLCAGCADSRIRDRIVLDIRDTNTQTELLKDRYLSLEKCVDIFRTAENATSQNKLNHPDVVHIVGLRREAERQEVKECKFCGTH